MKILNRLEGVEKPTVIAKVGINESTVQTVRKRLGVVWPLEPDQVYGIHHTQKILK